MFEKESAFVSYSGNDETSKMLSDAVNKLTHDVLHDNTKVSDTEVYEDCEKNDIKLIVGSNDNVILTNGTYFNGQRSYDDPESFPLVIDSESNNTKIYTYIVASDHPHTGYAACVRYGLSGLTAGCSYNLSFVINTNTEIASIVDDYNEYLLGIVVSNATNICSDKYYDQSIQSYLYDRLFYPPDNQIRNHYYEDIQYYTFPTSHTFSQTINIPFMTSNDYSKDTYIFFVFEGLKSPSTIIHEYGEEWYNDYIKDKPIFSLVDFKINESKLSDKITSDKIVKVIGGALDDNSVYTSEINNNKKYIVGTLNPSNVKGSDGDYYIQCTSSQEEYSNFTLTYKQSKDWVNDSITHDSNGYKIVASVARNWKHAPNNQYIQYTIGNLVVGTTYELCFDGKFLTDEQNQYRQLPHILIGFEATRGCYASDRQYFYSEECTGNKTYIEGGYGYIFSTTERIKFTPTAESMTITIEQNTESTTSPTLNTQLTLSNIILKTVSNEIVAVWYKIDGVWSKFEASSGGGSGVTITPSLLSGTPIADYTIGEETSGTLYAPTPTTVAANPVSQATANLDKLLVDQTTYTVPAVYSGATQPVSSKENDIFAKTLVSMPYMHPDSSGVVTSETTDYANNEISIYGSVTDEFKDIYTYIIDNLIVGNTYTFSCSFQQDGDATKVWPNANDRNCISICYPYLTSSADVGISETVNTVSTLTDGTAITLYNDTNAHDYTFTFEANNATMYLQLFLTKYKNGPQYGGVNRNIEWLDISITGVGSEIDGLYFNKGGNYQLIDGVKKIIPKTSQGDVLATIINYDGSTTDIHGSTGGGGGSVVPNPSEVATDTLEKVGINGTVYDLKDVSALHPEDVNATYEWTRPTAQNSIVTDIVPNITDRIEMQYIYDEISGSWGNNNPCMFYAAPRYYYQYYGTSGYELSVGNLINWSIWGENMIKTPGHIVTLKYNEDFASHNVYIYDETAQTEMKSQQAMNYSEACTGTLVFFNESSSGLRTMYSKLKYFKIWDVTTQELKHHFVPIADGLYDMVTDRSYQYTNNNYEHGNVTGYLDFTSVKPNPTDTPTDILETIKIDDTTYSLGVVANPSGSATASLTKLQVGETIYNVAGGGGGGGSNSLTKIWDYVDDNSGSVLFGTFTKTLHDDINNYDKIIMEVMSASGDSGNWDATEFYEFSVTAINAAKNPGRVTINTFETRSSSYYIHETTLQKIVDNGSNINGLVRVYGVKSGGSGGGSPEKKVLYNTETSSVDTEITLSDDISNYESLEFVVGFNASDKSKVSFRYSVEDFKVDFPYTGSTATTNPQFITCVFDSCFMCFQCGSADNKIYIVRGSDTALYSINGIKYGGGGGSDQSYTTYERQIGTWIDGKPLYQVTQVYDKTTITSSTLQFAHNVANIDQICGMECLYSFSGYLPDEKYMAILPWCYNENNSSLNSYYGGYRIGKDKIFVQIGNNLYSSTSEWTFTFKYTKTTDT